MGTKNKVTINMMIIILYPKGNLFHFVSFVDATLRMFIFFSIEILIVMPSFLKNYLQILKSGRYTHLGFLPNNLDVLVLPSKMEQKVPKW